jgi:endonuclease/exonuclease/phosphatase family metal-dependent hydrolase
MPGTLRVATFNVRHCEGLDGAVDVGRVAATIGATGAELVALQELDCGLPRSARADQPAALAEACGLHVSFHPTLHRRLGEYGIALACADDVEVSFEELPRVGDEEPRGLLRAAWRGVTVLATHLSRDAEARARQIETLAEVAGAAPTPVVVVGDLNAEIPALGPLVEAGLSPCGPAPTLPARHPRRQIDHVLTGEGIEVTRFWTIATDASDHRPLVADLVLT